MVANKDQEKLEDTKRAIPQTEKGRQYKDQNKKDNTDRPTYTDSY